MGPTSSSPAALQNIHSNMRGSQVRLHDDRVGDILDIQNDFLPTELRRPILKSGFAGIWSVNQFENPSPCQRTGQFTVTSLERNSMIIGYGLSDDKTALGDVWELSLSDFTWKNLHIREGVVSPRAFSSACIQGSRIFVFGGCVEEQYFSDLHFIDLDTGSVSMVETNNEQPSPRSSPLIAALDNTLYVWGGYDGSWPSQLHKLNLKSLIWESDDPGFSGRNAIPYAIYNNKLYGYGCSKSGGFIVIDMMNDSASIQKSEGTSPPSEYISAGMVLIDYYMFYFGGKSEEDEMLVYACNMRTLKWFIFWMIPDGETVSPSDGLTDETGIFHLPKMFGFSASYSPTKRNVIACLGYPSDSPQMFSIFSVGEALSILHLRDDLLDTLL